MRRCSTPKQRFALLPESTAAVVRFVTFLCFSIGLCLAYLFFTLLRSPHSSQARTRCSPCTLNAALLISQRRHFIGRLWVHEVKNFNGAV